jgi:hypothetical protein
MAHQLTPEEVDQLASQAAAAVEPKKAETLAIPLGELPALAYGAEGASAGKLVALLNALGFDTNDIIREGLPPRIDETVLADVRVARSALGVPDTPEVPGVEGEVIGLPTWQALYEAAAAKFESEQQGA